MYTPSRVRLSLCPVNLFNMDGPEIRVHPGDASAWDLGHSLAAVGPGWWPLVRQAHAEAETAGGLVAQVRQKHALFDVLVHSHPAG